MHSYARHIFSVFLILVSLIFASCGNIQPSPEERYELSSKPLVPAKVNVVDTRPVSGKEALSFDGGYVVGDSKISPDPAAFIASEITNLTTTDSDFSALGPRLAERQISLTKFTVGTRVPNVTTNSSQPPGLQGFDYAMKSLVARVDRQLVIELELEIEGRRYGTLVTWTTKWNPPSQATTFPASYAIRTVLSQFKSDMVSP